MDQDHMNTVKEVAERIGISTHQVYRRIMRGDIKATESRGRQLMYQITDQELQRYIDAGGENLTPVRGDQSMLRAPQVAQMLGFTVETIRRMCYEGLLPHIRGAGNRGHLRIPRAAVEKYLAGK